MARQGVLQTIGPSIQPVRGTTAVGPARAERCEATGTLEDATDLLRAKEAVMEVDWQTGGTETETGLQ